MKDYRVVVQDFIPQHAIISSSKVSEDSKFIFYNPDPKNKRDPDKNIIFYDLKGEIIESIKIRKIRYADGYKKLKILKEKPYEEEAFSAKDSADALEKDRRKYSQDKSILHKKGKKHIISNAVQFLINIKLL